MHLALGDDILPLLDRVVRRLTSDNSSAAATADARRWADGRAGAEGVLLGERGVPHVVVGVEALHLVEFDVGVLGLVHGLAGGRPRRGPRMAPRTHLPVR